MIISEFWTFPIPFVQITLDMLFVSMVIASYRGMIGSTAFNRLLSRRVPLLRYLSFIIFQVVMTIVYPSYQVLFDLAADSQYELIVFLLLPVIKTVMKKILSLAVSHMEDLIPETVIFTVDFFNALYLATCMQRATSVVTVAVIMIFDFSQTAFALFRLHRCTQRIMTQLQQANHSDNLLEAIRSLCFNHRRQKGQVRRGIRVYSCMPHQLTVSGTILLSSLNDPMHSTEDLQSFLQLCKVKALAPKSPLSHQSQQSFLNRLQVDLPNLNMCCTTL
ncbi:Hypothetical protein PHPALM_11212 [Phytophthora palmivora]|uniref:Transmembrane protein n=1 Tax=Phytophthora palmivora TaxID=4796 RepID=A0A2P4Y2T8_9STRA|nr:Hypothetical protein PHPALM_11212 [Phytophthora palmivora]